LKQPTLTRADVEYITERFVALEDACRRHGDDPGIVRAEIEREFAPYDRIRFGGPVSRDRLIGAVRERYASVFAREPASEMAS
jgi:hypothetical protein